MRSQPGAVPFRRRVSIRYTYETNTAPSLLLGLTNYSRVIGSSRHVAQLPLRQSVTTVLSRGKRLFRTAILIQNCTVSTATNSSERHERRLLTHSTSLLSKSMHTGLRLPDTKTMTRTFRSGCLVRSIFGRIVFMA